MKDKGILPSFFLSPLSKITNPENNSQFKLVIDFDSIRVNDLSTSKTKPVTPYNNLLTFRDTDKKFEVEGEILKFMKTEKYNVDLAKLSDKKLMSEFEKERQF